MPGTGVSGTAGQRTYGGRTAVAGGRTAVAGGRTAVAGGRTAVAGGRTAVAGGRTAVAGGRTAHGRRRYGGRSASVARSGSRPSVGRGPGRLRTPEAFGVVERRRASTRSAATPGR
ncbi:hypothetical protein ACVV2G_16545 [Streptomyces ziwulingensis]